MSAHVKYIEKYVTFVRQFDGGFLCWFWDEKPKTDEAWLIRVPIPEKLWNAPELKVEMVPVD